MAANETMPLASTPTQQLPASPFGFFCWDHGCNGRRFSSPSNLRRHHREYTQKPPGSLANLAGPRCWDHGCNGRLFSSTSNLYRHYRERIWNKGTTCPKCHTTFKPKQNKMASGKRPEVPRCWEHGCDGRAFPKYSDLYRHQRHMLARQVTCPQCSYVFKRSDSI
ncbi:uncharacterized protein P884DRAFT_257121 [Thermothelomyces heterothallicus CBS 202.75]|uniref:uncharacterized protein n=1 Tax=Thermothelomyces heterothallicus CBS 202.75 TaxID=1149848 RepID=UPI003743B93E